MSENTNNVAVTTDRLEDELEALIGDATSDHKLTSAVAEINLEEIEAAATVEATKSAAYAEQPGEETEVTTAAASGKSAAPRAARPSRAAGASPFDVVKAAVNDDEALQRVAMLVTADEPSAELVDDLAKTINNLAKKVGDKASNLLRHKSQPAKLQKYTRLGMDLLIDKGSVTSADLTKHLQSSGYTIGTARSQANQLMSLLPALKIADKSGRTIAIRPDSVIAQQYKAALTAA